MESPKLPNNINTEDLLKQLDTKETVVAQEDSHKYPNDIIPFLTFYNLKEGTNLVRVKLLYLLYTRWSKSPLTRAQFGHQLGNYFIVDRAATRLNETAFNITDKAYRLLLEKSRDRVKAKSWSTHFQNFIKNYDLKPGTYFIESFVLYYLYDSWVYKNKKKQPLSERQFRAFLKLHFENRRITQNRTEWYGVTEDILQHLPEEHLQQLRSGRQFKHGKIQKKQS
jgi:arginyl-tRNA--protein-N-Asp/Glu arginylyltransferase